MKPSNGHVYDGLVFERPKVLLIAPHNHIAEPFRTALEKHGFAVTVADSSSTQSRLSRTEQFALVVTLWQNGLHQTGEAGVFSRTVDALFLLGHQTPAGTVEAFQNGVYRFEAHRTDADKFVKTVRELLEAHHNSEHILAPEQAKTQNHHKRPTLTGIAFNDLIGQSPQINEVRQLIKCISQFPGVPVLITGETGAGKELVADLLHHSSASVGKPLIKINCSAIPEALFESQLFGHRKDAFTGAHSAQKGLAEAAQDGVLFFDEISTLKPEQQPKLLRLLEDGSYLPVGETIERRTNAWIIAATNQNLEELVGKNLFRRDLYYRLKAAEIKLPPLRERREDIPLLSKKFLEQFSTQYGVGAKFLSELAENALLRHNWPGNVRELKQLMLSLTISVKGDMILPQHLPPEFSNLKQPTITEPNNCSALRDAERAHLVCILEQAGFNLKQTALRLGISRNALKRKIKKYKISAVRNGPF